MAFRSSPAHEEEDAAGAAAVCCMCGDHGLPRELFRCKFCRVRLQHGYCSDLYPRATAYGRCNWCLREPQGGSNKPAAETKRKAATTTTASDEERPQHRHEGWCSSRRPPAELGSYPVKKRRKADDEKRAPAEAGVKGSCSNAGESKEELMRAGKTPRARVKVQRYKLLAEVISC